MNASYGNEDCETCNLIKVLWGKKKKKDNGVEIRYPLLFHMLDTAAVAHLLWTECMQSHAQASISRQLKLSPDDAGKSISSWAGLHDLGKASPGFQMKSREDQCALSSFLNFQESHKDVPHNIASAIVLSALLEKSCSCHDKRVSDPVAVAISGHHGTFPKSFELEDNRQCIGGPAWDKIRERLFCRFLSLWPTPQPCISGGLDNAGLMFLAGFASVADWIASNDDFFPYEVHHSEEEHIQYALGQAREALKGLGWFGWRPPSDTPGDIRGLFPAIKHTRPLQDRARDLARKLAKEQALVIIEAPMGEGKTEAALYIADAWISGLKQKGFYFALPTMATSDQMFGRVRSYLNNRYQNQQVNLMLLHGHAALSAEFETLKRCSPTFLIRDVSGENGYDGAPAAAMASEWFTYRKRGFLAPFGVGTIDQALMAVLQTRHVFVRLFGLANKTIIVDEVHAYDTYMTTLLERLLEWLAALGSTVVMLSATLPREKKDALLKAYARGLTRKDIAIPDKIASAHYPRIAWTTGAEFGAKNFETSPFSRREIRIKWVNGDPSADAGRFALGEALQQALHGGGCAAVICNTVDQAQEVYLALKPYFPELDAGDGHSELDLLHARYLFGDRLKREERTLLRFGKPGGSVASEDGTERAVRRPHRAVLVSTQIIEQSLDLDFDLMVSEMAPVDLLLQRAGRLHRHERARPAKLKEPVLWIWRPSSTKDGTPDFGHGTEAVYDPYVLLRSWLALREKEAIRIPDDVEALIEEVYSEKECPQGLPAAIRKRWEESRVKHENDMESERDEAKQRWIKWPGYDGEIWHMIDEPREEDDPTLHQAHKALTRLTGPTVRVLCLYGAHDRPSLDIQQVQQIETTLTPSMDMIPQLLKRSAGISRRVVVDEITQSESTKLPGGWSRSPLLRHYRVLTFGSDNICRQLQSFILRLDDELGLVIEKKGSGGTYA